jgi:hypothetical protein
MNENRLARMLMVAALLALVAGESALASAPRGCIMAWVPAPVRLPDGSVHGPGVLRLCTARVLSPASSLHEMAMDGEPVGLLAGRAYRSEIGPLARPVVFFRRAATGELQLLGYVVPARSGGVAVDLSRATTRGSGFTGLDALAMSRASVAMRLEPSSHD